MKHPRAVMLLILLGTCTISCGSLQFPALLPWPTATRGPTYTVTSNSLTFHEVWRQVVGRDFVGRSDAPLMTVAAGTIVLPISDARETRLVALRAQDGKRLWTRKLDNPGFPDIPVGVMSVLADSKRVYITLLSFVAEAFDLTDGKPLWTVEKLRAHTGYDIFPILQDDTLQIYSTPKDTAVYNVNRTSGQIKSIEEYPRGLIMKTSVIECFDNVFSLSCANNNAIKGSWQISTGGQIQKWPVFVNSETMVFAVGSSFKFIMAVDLATGRVLWQTPANVTSNIAVMHSIVYSIRADAALVAQDALTGRQIGLLQFNNSALQQQHVGEYWVVAGDSMLFVYFGDSQELIALGP